MPPPPYIPPSIPNDKISAGVVKAMACLAILAVLIAVVNFVGMFGFGLLEWIGLVPLFLYERSKQRPQAAKGVLLVGLIVFLLQAACYGLILLAVGTSRKMH